jgi:hypothetical protein
MALAGVSPIGGRTFLRILGQAGLQEHEENDRGPYHSLHLAAEPQ